jgi:hypothetical protein
MIFRKGRAKTGGRKKGTSNKATESIKDLLLCVLEDSRNRQEWEYWLKHKDPHYRWEAFKLAQFYMFGKPVQPVASEEMAPPIKIDISAIPQFRVKAKTEDEQS